MRLPEIAAELRLLAKAHGLPRLSELADEMRRRKRSTKAPPASKKMTPGLAKQILAYKKNNPAKTQFEIAELFGVNQGRVSEVLIGKRH